MPRNTGNPALPLFGLLAALAVTSVSTTEAAVDGSPHDLISQEYLAIEEQTGREMCRLCHLPVGVESDFLESVPVSLGHLTRGSLTCFACHDGITIVSPEADASMTAFHPDSHGYNLSGLQGGLSEEITLPMAGEGRMDCMTCHTPHENEHRPFLRLEVREICLHCHQGMMNSEEKVPDRPLNHRQLVEPLESELPEMPLKVDPAFMVGFPAEYPLSGGRLTPGVHWDLGGHLGAGASGPVLCITCHAVHGDEEYQPMASLLSLDPVNERANLFCEGCHRGERSDGEATPHTPNPGGTTTARTYHPCDDDQGNGPGRILEIREPPGWPFGGGDPKMLLCTSCHRAHRAAPETPILRTVVEARTFCEECHQESPSIFHHPVGTVEDADNTCMTTAPEPAYGGEREGIVCSDCHRAHNAGLGTGAEHQYVPVLRDNRLSSDACTRCHNENDPTCTAEAGYNASHFMGDPSLGETYDDPDPPFRTDPWPESGLLSTYGPGGNEVTCFSCHAFAKGALTSGDDADAPFLLARAGNGIEWEEEKGDTYLCVGCHSANPGTMGTGHTHPLMNADMSVLGKEAQAPVSATPEGRINCDSCHRSHNALTTGGYYIMEVIRSANEDPQAIHPQIDFSVICHRCHDKDEY